MVKWDCIVITNKESMLVSIEKLAVDLGMNILTSNTRNAFYNER